MGTATQHVRLFYRSLVRHFNDGKTSWGKNELVEEISKVYISFLEDQAIKEEALGGACSKAGETALQAD